MRGEGRRFSHGRCLVPASWFYEFTGSRSPKSKWRFALTNGEWTCLAGLWRPADAGDPVHDANLPTRPDIEPIHNRQVVVLDRHDWAEWLDPAASPERLLRPSPAETLAVERVR